MTYPSDYYNDGVGMRLVAWGRAIAWGDFDSDGWVDLCIGDRLLRNANGSFALEFDFAVSRYSAYSTCIDCEPPSAMAWADYDGDGRIDIMHGNRLYRNTNGTGAGFVVDTYWYSGNYPNGRWTNYTEPSSMAWAGSK